MLKVIIFLKYEIITTVYSAFNHRFENDVNIDLMCEFAVVVEEYIIKYQF